MPRVSVKQGNYNKSTNPGNLQIPKTSFIGFFFLSQTLHLQEKKALMFSTLDVKHFPPVERFRIA